MEEVIKQFNNNEKRQALNRRIISIILFVFLLVSILSSVYLFKELSHYKKENGKLKYNISMFTDEKGKIESEKEQLKGKIHSLELQIREAERETYLEDRNMQIKSYYADEENKFDFYYNSHKYGSELGVFILRENKIIYVLSPYRDEYQDGKDCENNDKCIVVQNNKYSKEPDKITVIDKNYQSIEQAISSLLKEKGFDISNCQLKINDYEHGDKVILILSDKNVVNDEDINKYEEENGPADGAYSTRNKVSWEKTKLLCSEYGQPEWPVDKFFIFNDNRKDIFLFYESSNAERGSYIYPDSIQLLY